MNIKTIGITIGDPAGIGSEVISKSLHKIGEKKDLRWILYGSKDFFLPEFPLPGWVEVKEITTLKGKELKFGKYYKEYGKVQIQSLISATKDALNGKISALVTSPINKRALMDYGLKYEGQSELLSDYSKTEKFAMMFWSEKLKVILVTTHIPLRDVSKNITEEKIIEKTILGYEFLKDKVQIQNPAIGILGLNPHCEEKGEKNYYGKEEKTKIKPAVFKLKKMGVNAVGPLSPESAFLDAKKYHILIAMYHDQALPLLKFCFFNEIVNLTIGLPFIRTSPPHGVAYDIAGKGIANPQGMLSAINLALKFITNLIP